MNAPSGIPLRRDPTAVHRALLSSLARAAIATGRAGDQRSASNLLAEQWPDDRIAGLLTRAAVSPTSLSNATALGEVAAIFLESMRTQSAGAEVLGRGLQVSFSHAATIRLPVLAPGIAEFIGEVAGDSGQVVRRFRARNGAAQVGLHLRTDKRSVVLVKRRSLDEGGLGRDVCARARCRPVRRPTRQQHPPAGSASRCASAVSRHRAQGRMLGATISRQWLALLHALSLAKLSLLLRRSRQK